MLVFELLYLRRIALKSDYHRKRMYMLEYAPMVYNYLENLAESFIIHAGKNQFIQGNNFNVAPVHRFAIAINKLCLHWIVC